MKTGGALVGGMVAGGVVGSGLKSSANRRGKTRSLNSKGTRLGRNDAILSPSRQPNPDQQVSQHVTHPT